MRKTAVIIVGGGPAGSSCAWQLRRRGLECLILDKAVFPRPKLCGGWITPELVADLEMDIAAYPHRFLTFEVTRAHLFGIGLTMRSPQHSIRRVEFDDWLLKRSGAEAITHQVKHIEHTPNGYRIDDRFECAALVGAGGTACPVYRSLFREINPRARTLQVAALEHELPYAWQDRDCHLWFFEKGLPGYSWYVPKENGYLNLGVGGMAQRLQDKGDSIHRHWEHFVTTLRRRRLIDGGLTLEPRGYSYYLRDGLQRIRHENAFLVGDAAGLATRDLAEGIGPAIRSGILAADAIADGGEYSLESVSHYSLRAGLTRRALAYGLTSRKVASAAVQPTHGR